MTSMYLPPAQIPMVDAAGRVSREWYRFFSDSFQRVGGFNGLSTTDVDAGSFAAMQPALASPQFSDLMQGGSAGDAIGDVMQPAIDQTPQFWSP